MKNLKISKWLQWTIGIFGISIILIAGTAWYLSVHWKPILESKIKETIKNSTDSLYSINFSDLRLNLLTGNLMLDSIEFKPDTNIYNQLKSKNEAPASLYTAKVKTLIFNRVSIWQAYFQKEIELNAIIIDQPALTVIKNSAKKRTATEGKTLYEKISKILNSIRIKNIVLNDVGLNYTNNTLKTPKSTILKNLSVKVSDLLIDSLSQHDKSRFYYTKDVFFEIKDYKSKTADKMYNLIFSGLSGSISKKQVKLTGLKLTPLYPEMEFSRKYKVQHDRYEFTFGDITISNVDFFKLDSQDKLIATKMEITNADMAIFLNRGLPPPDIDKKMNFPHIALRRLPVNTRIDTVEIKNVNIAYTEYSPQSSNKGTLTFKKLAGTITNVTNNSLSLLKKNHAYANLSAFIMGSSKINVAIDFNLTDPEGSFSYKGNLAWLDMKVLNPLSKDLALIEINSGIVSKANFYVKGNAKGSSGNLDLYYTDLKIKLLKRDDETLKLEKKGVLSLLANTLVIKNNNPDNNEPLRKGPITFSRPRSASFFNLMWKSLFVGMREAVGLGAVPVKDQKKVTDKMIKEEEKNQRKTERQKKRDKNKNQKQGS